MLSVKSIEAKDTYFIRKRILRDNRSDLSVDFEGDDNEGTLHFGFFEAKKLIGISSYMPASNPEFKGAQYQLRGMAFLEPYQGKGLGAKLLTFGIERLQEMDIDICWCNARTPAVSFYERQGFQTFGNTFTIENAGPHIVMYKNV